MPAMLPIPKADTPIVGDEMQRVSKFWYDWFLRIGVTLSDPMTVTSAPAVSASSGTITAATCALRYKQIGRIVLFDATVTITDPGSGSVALKVTDLPFSALRATSVSGYDVGTGAALTGQVATTTITSFYYNATYPGITTTLLISGTCET